VSCTYAPFVPRPVRHLGIRSCHGFQLKTYSIVYGDVPLNSNAFEDGMRLAERELPSSAVTAERPGVGFVIMHQGRTGDYLILCWWDRENELPLRVFARDEKGWRAAAGGESVCVWDLRVIWWEREAYVNTLLSGGAMDDYLAACMNGFA
jgi:hypothetical protein